MYGSACRRKIVNERYADVARNPKVRANGRNDDSGRLDAPFRVPARCGRVPEPPQVVVDQCRLCRVQRVVGCGWASHVGGRLVGARNTRPEPDPALDRRCRGGIVRWFIDCRRTHLCGSLLGTGLNAKPHSLRRRLDPRRPGCDGSHPGPPPNASRPSRPPYLITAAPGQYFLAAFGTAPKLAYHSATFSFFCIDEKRGPPTFPRRRQAAPSRGQQ